MSSTAKSQLRKNYKAILKNLPKETVKHESAVVHSLLLEAHEYQNSKRVSIFTSMDGEIDTFPIIQRMLEDDNKHVFIPTCIKTDMKMVRITSMTDLYSIPKNAWGIIEPSYNDSSREDACHQLDLIILPGLLFDRQRHRLGHGKGYYDTYLSKFSKDRPFTIALALSAQLIEVVPTENHDVKPDRLLTPLGCF